MSVIVRLVFFQVTFLVQSGWN